MAIVVPKKQLEVIYDKILVRKDTKEKIAGGIILPEGTAKGDDVDGGLVIAVGKGYPIFGGGGVQDDFEPWKKTMSAMSFVPMSVKVGDYVMFLKKMFVEVSVDGDKYMVGPEGGIAMIVREELWPKSEG